MPPWRETLGDSLERVVRDEVKPLRETECVPTGRRFAYRPMTVLVYFCTRCSEPTSGPIKMSCVCSAGVSEANGDAIHAGAYPAICLDEKTVQREAIREDLGVCESRTRTKVERALASSARLGVRDGSASRMGVKPGWLAASSAMSMGGDGRGRRQGRLALGLGLVSASSWEHDPPPISYLGRDLCSAPRPKFIHRRLHSTFI